MALTTISYNVAFANHLSTKKFIFTDTTDYAGQGVTIANVKFTIKVTAPTGVIYNNLGNFGAPDIVPNTNRNNTTTILVPLLSGLPEVGLYTFQVSVNDTINTAGLTKTFTYNFASPSVTLSQDVNCIAGLLTSTDSTNYVVNATTPMSSFTITDANTGSNYIKIAGDQTGLFQAGVIFSISGSTGNNADYIVLTTSYDKLHDKTQINVTTVASATADGIVYVKYNKIFYPPVLSLPPLVGYTSVIQSNSFYSTTNSFSVSTTNFYNFGGGIFIIDKTSGTAQVDINCDVNLCDIYCCWNSVFMMWQSSIGVNSVLAENYSKKYILISSLASQVRTAIECGESEDVNNLTTQILTIGECKPGCSCSDNGTPTLITGLGGGSGTSVVATTGNGIVVSPSVVGNVTTYTLSLSSALVTLINSKYNTNLVSSASINVQEVVNGDGSKTYTPILIPSIPTLKDTSAFRISIIYSNYTSPTVSINVLNTTVVGPNLQAASAESISYVDPNWNTYNNYFRIYGFQAAANNTYKVEITSAILEYTDLLTGIVYPSTEIKNFSSLIKFELLDQKNGQFFFRFLNGQTGLPITNRQMTAFSNILLNVLISE